MMNYDALPDLLRVSLLLVLFLILCVSIYMLSLTVRRKAPITIILTLLCVVLSGSMVVLYSADVRSLKHDYAPATVSRWLCEKPIVFAVLLIVAITVFLTYIATREIHLRRTTITRATIKESIDHLPTGLCFYAHNGRVMLVNHRMNQLCHDLLGHALQNGVQMWERISNGKVRSGIVRLSAGSQPGFRLPDGTVWTFSREDVHGVFQITAVDTTQLYELAGELEQKNMALVALQQRLKQYDENVEKLTQTKERLRTKARIHSELGQSLLAARSYLLGSEEETKAPVDAWKSSIALMRQKAKEGAERSSLPMLIRTAKDYGITVEIEGQMPKQRSAEQLFLEAATEALTNAVRHAEAKTLWIRFSETSTHDQVSFQNDGKLPESEIIEGGGLGALRRKVEMAGGSMNVCCQPVYTLTIIITKDGGEIL